MGYAMKPRKLCNSNQSRGSDNLDSGIKEIEETLVIKDMILTIGTQN